MLRSTALGNFSPIDVIEKHQVIDSIMTLKLSNDFGGFPEGNPI